MGMRLPGNKVHIGGLGSGDPAKRVMHQAPSSRHESCPGRRHMQPLGNLKRPVCESCPALLRYFVMVPV